MCVHEKKICLISLCLDPFKKELFNIEYGNYYL